MHLSRKYRTGASPITNAPLIEVIVYSFGNYCKEESFVAYLASSFVCLYIFAINVWQTCMPSDIVDKFF